MKRLALLSIALGAVYIAFYMWAAYEACRWGEGQA